MAINSFMPYIGLATAILVPKLKRFQDSSNPYKSKKTSIAQFKNLWYGGEYLIHYKQSASLNILYVTMMYGLGMPILFPLAAFNFIN